MWYCDFLTRKKKWMFFFGPLEEEKWLFLFSALTFFSFTLENFSKKCHVQIGISLVVRHVKKNLKKSTLLKRLKNHRFRENKKNDCFWKQSFFFCRLKTVIFFFFCWLKTVIFFLLLVEEKNSHFFSVGWKHSFFSFVLKQSFFFCWCFFFFCLWKTFIFFFPMVTARKKNSHFFFSSFFKNIHFFFLLRIYSVFLTYLSHQLMRFRPFHFIS